MLLVSRPEHSSLCQRLHINASTAQAFRNGLGYVFVELVPDRSHLLFTLELLVKVRRGLLP